MIISAAILLIIMIVLVVLAERSLRRQRGTLLKRTPEEDRQIGHSKTMWVAGAAAGVCR
jgi:ABC-type Fe3+ transport system permease subunit